jgi:hypothetical protein
MAKKQVVQTEESAQEEPSFAEDKTTLAYMMDHPEEAPQFRADSETPEERDAREAAEAAAATAATETPEEKAAREQAEADAAAATAAAEAAKPKFATVEEWERGYKEAETRMHTATEETAKEKAAREAADARAAEAERKLAEKEAAAKPPETSLEEKENQLLAQMTEIRTKAAREIADLDRSDPDKYYQDWAAINSKADLEIKRAGRKLGLEGQAEDIGQVVKAEVKAERDADEAKREVERKAKAEEDRKASGERAWQEALDYGKKAGLDLDDPDESADYDLFDMAGQKLPEELRGKGATKEVCDWMVSYVRKRTGKKIEQTDEERRQVLETQRRNAILGKGGTPPPRVTKTEPRTMQRMMEERGYQ